ncbi:unnamed protein product [Gongylonema pulchrum]|uniref:Alba domain-containing protein n=1 Tax=Gongylonema pulchrum TaxID=637853 RepID=A0A183EA44_9BILA|nr:unnamed protein product [Gongylonema pulchrum]
MSRLLDLQESFGTLLARAISTIHEQKIVLKNLKPISILITVREHIPKTTDEKIKSLNYPFRWHIGTFHLPRNQSSQQRIPNLRKREPVKCCMQRAIRAAFEYQYHTKVVECEGVPTFGIWKVCDSGHLATAAEEEK